MYDNELTCESRLFVQTRFIVSTYYESLSVGRIIHNFIVFVLSIYKAAYSSDHDAKW